MWRRLTREISWRIWLFRMLSRWYCTCEILPKTPRKHGTQRLILQQAVRIAEAPTAPWRGPRADRSLMGGRRPAARAAGPEADRPSPPSAAARAEIAAPVAA